MRTKKEKCDCLNYCGDDHQRIISGLVDPCESYKSAQARAKIDNRDRRQKTILAWARQTFGISVADNTEERIKRLIEEALELAQASRSGEKRSNDLD